MLLKLPLHSCKLRFLQSRRNFFFNLAELFRIRLGSVLQFKDLVGVSDISAAFGCLHLWLTYIIIFIFSGISPSDCRFRPWSTL